MCRGVCVKVCVWRCVCGRHVCLHNDHCPMSQLLGVLSMPAAILCWGTAHTCCTYTLTCHTLSVSTLSVSSALLCLPPVTSRTDACVRLQESVCGGRVWALCDLCVLSVGSPLIHSVPKPLVAHWTLRETPTTNPKGALTGMHWRETAHSAPLKAFQPHSFFFYLWICTQSSTHTSIDIRFLWTVD